MEGSPQPLAFRERDFGDSDEDLDGFALDGDLKSRRQDRVARMDSEDRRSGSLSPMSWSPHRFEAPVDLEGGGVPPSPSRQFSPRGALAHGLSGWDSPPLGPAPSPVVHPVRFNLGDLHGAMAETTKQADGLTLEDDFLEAPGGKKRVNKMQPGEAENGCPALCTKYGWWPLGFVMACLVLIVWFTWMAAEASVTTEAERDEALDLKEREKDFYKRRDAESAAIQAQTAEEEEEEEGLDVVAVFFLLFSALLGVFGMYSFCTRPKATERIELPTMEDVEEEARICRDTSGDATPGQRDDDDEDTTALIGAFEACDVDGSGQIDAGEFYAILSAIGCAISLEEVEGLVKECESFYANFARVSEVIKKVPLFAPLPDWQLRQLTESLKTINVPAGAVVIREGETGLDMFLVEEGELACTKRGIHDGNTLRKYISGEYFGERAMMVQESRAATITALTPCVLHKLSSASCQEFLHANKLIAGDLKAMEQDYKTTLLRKIPLLAQLSDSDVKAVAGSLLFVDIRRGEVVIQEGDVGSTDLFIVELGTLVARRRQTGDHALKHYTEGDFFGERALISDQPRAASVIAETDSRVLKLPHRTYEMVLLRNRMVRQQLHTATDAYGNKKADISGHLSGANKAWQRGFNKFSAFKPMSPVVQPLKVLTAGARTAETIARAAVNETETLARGTVNLAEHATKTVVAGALDVTTHVVSNVVHEAAGLAGFETRPTEEVEDDTQDGELDFEEFSQLMRGPLLAEFLAGTNGNWRKRVAQIQQLRRAYDIADVDGDNELEKDELSLVLVSLSPAASIDPSDIDHVWDVLRTDASAGGVSTAIHVGGVEGELEDEDALTALFSRFGTVLASTLRVRHEVKGGKQVVSWALVSFGSGAEAQAALDGTAVLSDPEHGGYPGLVTRKVDEVKATHSVGAMGEVMRNHASARAAAVRASGGGANFLTWEMFLAGLKWVCLDERASQIMDLGASNKWELISLLIDTKSSELEHNMLMEGLSPFEILGVKTLERLKKPMDTDGLKDVLHRVSAGELHMLTDEKKKAISNHRRNVAIYACFIGFITNVIPGINENFTVLYTGSNGINDGYWVCNPDMFTESTGFPDFPKPWNSSIDPADAEKCEMSEPLTIATFWAMDLVVMVICILMELTCLGMVAVRCSCMIAAEYDFRLVPLNAERAFVSNALIRACFEMGNPKSAVLGVDPDSGPETSATLRLKIMAMAAIYGGKIVFLGVMIKQIFKFTLPIHVLTWANSYAATMSSCFWDTLICAVIMEQVELVAMGVSTAPEVFNEVMERFASYQQKGGVQTRASEAMAAKVQQGLAEKRELSPLGQLQVVRAIGVAIVLEGSMHPTMELLLRHAIQYFGMKGKSMLTEPRNLDSVSRFLSDMAKLPPAEQMTVMSIHLLTMMLDGEMDDPEMQAWQRIGISIGRGPCMNEDALKGVACAFRNRRPITAVVLENALDDDDENDEAPKAKLSETIWHRITLALLS